MTTKSDGLSRGIVLLVLLCAFSFGAIVKVALADSYHVTCVGHGFVEGGSQTDGSFFSRVDAGCGSTYRTCAIYSYNTTAGHRRPMTRVPATPGPWTSATTRSAQARRGSTTPASSPTTPTTPPTGASDASPGSRPRHPARHRRGRRQRVGADLQRRQRHAAWARGGPARRSWRERAGDHRRSGRRRRVGRPRLPLTSRPDLSRGRTDQGWELRTGVQRWRVPRARHRGGRIVRRSRQGPDVARGQPLSRQRQAAGAGRDLRRGHAEGHRHHAQPAPTGSRPLAIKGDAFIAVTREDALQGTTLDGDAQPTARPSPTP